MLSFTHITLKSSRGLPQSPDFQESGLPEALRQGKPRKSVGIDGVSLELIGEICESEEGTREILRWFNEPLHSGRLPKHWTESIMVLLPKVRLPSKAKDTRPFP